MKFFSALLLPFFRCVFLVILLQKRAFACLRICVFVLFFHFISILHNLYKFLSFIIRVDETIQMVRNLEHFFTSSLCKCANILSFSRSVVLLFSYIYFFRSLSFFWFLIRYCAHIRRALEEQIWNEEKKTRKGQLNNYNIKITIRQRVYYRHIHTQKEMKWNRNHPPFALKF